MRSRHLLIVALAVAYCRSGLTLAGEGPFYRVVVVPDPPSGITRNTRMLLNDTGLVVGHELSGSIIRPYVWNRVTGQILTPIDRPSIIIALNNTGVAVGLSHNSGFGTESWTWSEETNVVPVPDVPDGPGSNSQASAINDAGTIAGTREGMEGTPGVFVWWPDGTVEGIPSSDAGEVVGISQDNWIVFNANYGDGGETFRWTRETGIDELANFPCGADLNNVHQSYAINRLGHACGYMNCYCGYWYEYCFRAFHWSPDHGVTMLPGPPDYGLIRSSVATDINDRDVIIGAMDWSDSDGPKPYVWDPVDGPRLLLDHIDPCETLGGPLRFAGVRAINNHGEILGTRGVGLEALLLTPYLRGDLDGDRIVTTPDLAILLAHFGEAGEMNYADGDVDCNRGVDISDLAILLANFGDQLP